MKKLLLIHDLCSVGKAGMLNMIPVLNKMKIEVCPVPTMLLSTHTGGYGKPVMHPLPGTYIKQCVDHFEREHVSFDGIFIGYLGNAEVARLVEDLCSRFRGIPVLFDPIMGDHGKFYSNFDETYCEALKPIVSHTDVLLPNMTEAALLCGVSYTEAAKTGGAKKIAENLHRAGAKAIVITSVPSGQKEIETAVFENEVISVSREEKVPYTSHGTGDLFDGVFAGNFLRGANCQESAKKAADFVRCCLLEKEKEGTEEREGLPFEKLLDQLV